MSPDFPNEMFEEIELFKYKAKVATLSELAPQYVDEDIIPEN